jgi:hypothetical protein
MSIWSSSSSAVVEDIAIAECPKERRLHGRHDVLCAHAVAEIGRTDGAVFDAMAQPLTRTLALGPDQSVQGLLDGAVADGVDGALETLPVCASQEIVEPFLIPVEDATVLAVRGVGLARRRGGTARRAIGHHLEGAEPEPLIAEAAPRAGAQHAHHRVVQALDGGKGIDPELQAPGLDEVLAGTERGADKATGIMHTGTASSERCLSGTHQGGAELLGGRQRRHLERCLRGLIGHAEVPATVAVVSPPGGSGVWSVMPATLRA